jgi:hypothetical protein
MDYYDTIGGIGDEEYDTGPDVWCSCGFTLDTIDEDCMNYDAHLEEIEGA